MARGSDVSPYQRPPFPAIPYTTHDSSMNPEGMNIHPLLRYNSPVSTGHPCCLKWDLRDPPQQARVHTTPPQPNSPGSDDNLIASSSSPLRRLSRRELAQPATTPPVRRISITCGLFLFRRPIEVRKHSAVTILDVLEALYQAANTPIHMDEWARFGPTEKRRFAQVYHQRCASGRPTSSLERGVMRVDCLAYTRFAGISLVDGMGTSGDLAYKLHFPISLYSPSAVDTTGISCVLTLDRNIHE